MKNNIFRTSIPIITIVTYVVMVVVNALANILPINNIGTGEISDYYRNLFAPAGITFSIWGLIYVLLLMYSVYQLTYYKGNKKELYLKIGLLFSISSVLNTIWIFMWHYDYIFITLLLMTGILICLILINLELKDIEFSRKDSIMIRIPFGVYFGWITVATIANVTTYLVSINWDMFNINEVLLTNIVILIGALIGSVSAVYYRCGAYALVIMWAYIGIIIKHTTVFNNQYQSVIITTIIGIIIVIFGVSKLIMNEVKN